MKKGLAWVVAGLILFVGAAGAQAELLQARLGVHQFPPDLQQELEIKGDGVPIWWVVGNSAAAKAGLKTGDVILSIGGAKVKSFADLAELIGARKAGDVIEVEYLRGQKANVAQATLSAWVGEVDKGAHKSALEYLRMQLAAKDGPALRRELAQHFWLLGERRNAAEELARAIVKFPSNAMLQSQWLDTVQNTGDFERFTREAVARSDKNPQSLELMLQKAEALMGIGKNEEAETLAAEIAKKGLGFFAWRTETLRALDYWTTSRMRQGKPLRDPDLDKAIPSTVWKNEPLAVARFWREQLGEKPTYVVEGDKPTEVAFHKASVLFGLAPYAMHGITIAVNGVEVPLAIVDTGASHTLLSTGTAEAAKVPLSEDSRSAIGSLAFTSRAGVVDELKIGDLVIRNVPVNVGNPPPLVMTKAKAALGVDLMHHLRFILDYEKSKVRVEQATTPVAKHEFPVAVWDIPLWTFPQHTLSQGRMPSGAYARALIDSGNFAQTLIWPRWGQENLPNHGGPSRSIFTYAMTNPEHRIKGLRLGQKPLPDWPALDMPPVTLGGVDLIDLLMGHDLLSQYRVTVDMQGRRLRLESPGPEFKPPKAQKPALFGFGIGGEQ